MKVKKLMTKNVGTVQPNDNLARAVQIMWKFDCGAVPIVDKNRKAIGIVTDRDIAIATATKMKTPAEIGASEFCKESLSVCTGNTGVKKALRLMAKSGNRRLPVINKDGTLKGIFSVADVLRIKKHQKLKTSALETLETLSAAPN
ncbi:MAG: CBS domain-containing protein [Pyrinomonadaceae bacterium]